MPLKEITTLLSVAVPAPWPVPTRLMVLAGPGVPASVKPAPPAASVILTAGMLVNAVPLLGENRVIASLGMDGLRRPVNVGLRALLDVAQLDPAKKPLVASDIGFRIGPRINAAGRMDVASDVVELFTTRDPERARTLAQKLDQLNADRRAAEKAVLDQIDAMLADGR